MAGMITPQEIFNHIKWMHRAAKEYAARGNMGNIGEEAKLNELDIKYFRYRLHWALLKDNFLTKISNPECKITKDEEEMIEYALEYKLL